MAEIVALHATFLRGNLLRKGQGAAMRLARRIRKARQRARLSQQELASILGVSRSAVANWESDRGIVPTSEHILRLAKALDASIEWLATGRGADRYAVTNDETPAADVVVVDDPVEMRLLRAFRDAPSRAHRRIIDFAESCTTGQSLEARTNDRTALRVGTD